MPEEPEPDADAYAVALEEGRRAIDQQRDDLKSVRDRATALLSVAGIAAAFLGGLARRDSKAPLAYLTIVAAAAFVAIAFIVARILWWKKVTFAQDPKQILSWIEHAGYSTARVRQAAAYYHAVNYEANRDLLQAMVRDYQVGLGILVVEVVALMVALRGH